MLQVGPVIERICGCRVTLHRRYDIALQLPTVAHQALIGGSFESVVIDAAMAQSQSVPQFVRQRAPLRTGRSQQAVGSFEWDIGGSAEGDHQIVPGSELSSGSGLMKTSESPVEPLKMLKVLVKSGLVVQVP